MLARVTPSRHRAFTLVELLVVVGLIAILIAILMPVVSKARQQARTIYCAANLRSIGHALTMYTQQFRYYPGAIAQQMTSMSGQGYSGAVWPARIRAFLGGEKGVFFCPAEDERCRWTDSGPLPVVAAPADSVFTAVGYNAGEPMVHIRAYFSYGYNCFGMPNTYGASQALPQKGLGAYISDLNPADREMPASRVRMPEDMIALTDSNADGEADFITEAFDVHLPGRVHAGGANVLFCDGHVTWLPYKDLVPSDRTDPAQAQIVRRWNNDHSLGLPDRD